jgi:hypothetical protein
MVRSHKFFSQENINHKLGGARPFSCTFAPLSLNVCIQARNSTYSKPLDLQMLTEPAGLAVTFWTRMLEVLVSNPCLVS